VLSRLCPDLAGPDLSALTRLAEGAPGRALRLAAEGGLDLYREMVDLLSTLPEIDAAALHDLGDRVGRPGTEARFRTVTDLLSWWLARMIRAQACGGEMPEVVRGEAGLGQRLSRAASLDRWVEVWEKITRLFGRADSVNLDRKQVVLSAFLALENLTRP